MKKLLFNIARFSYGIFAAFILGFAMIAPFAGSDLPIWGYVLTYALTLIVIGSIEQVMNWFDLKETEL